MTIPLFGRVTPSQMDMLFLVGYRISGSDVTLEIPDEERTEYIVQAREDLKQRTGRDFGYDLAAWHDFLASNKDYGYTHPYAYSGVRRAVEEAMLDPERIRIVSQLEE